MTEQQLSFVRSAAKIIGAILAARGIPEVDVNSLVSLIEPLAGAGLVIYGMWKSHKAHA